MFNRGDYGGGQSAVMYFWLVVRKLEKNQVLKNK